MAYSSLNNGSEFLYTYIYMNDFMLVHIYIYMYISLEIYTCMHVYIYIFSYGVHSHTYIHTHVAVCCGALQGVNIHTLICRATAQPTCWLICRKYAKTYKSHIFMNRYLKATSLIFFFFKIHIVNEN